LKNCEKLGLRDVKIMQFKHHEDHLKSKLQ
jgi:hypothetical protein